MTVSKVLAAAALGFSLVACSDAGDPRPQLLVIIETDLPSVFQAAERDDLSADAAVDALRIDVYRPDGSLIRSLVVIAPNADDWPVSFGIPASEELSSVLVQARVFRADRAREGEGADEGLLVPQPALSVNRLVSLSFPEKGIQIARVTLQGDCLGVPPSFEAPASTCIDASRLAAAATDGVDGEEAAGDQPSLVGTWPVAVDQPCVGTAPAGATCIKGGFTTLGEEGLTGVTDGFAFVHDPVPLRPVQLTPFFADIEEYTVDRLRDALARQPDLLEPDDVFIRDEDNDFRKDCTFLGAQQGDNDHLPLNCVTYAGARRLCAADDGDLLSEAQWEHAARGRGQHRPFAWGSSPPDCCHGVYLGCPGSSSTPSAPNSGKCGPDADISRDGLVDLTGNLQEIVLDSNVGYDAPCWSKLGVPKNPVCEDDSVLSKTWRGGFYEGGVALAHLALRRQGLQDPFKTTGFRCAYPDSSL